MFRTFSYTFLNREKHHFHLSCHTYSENYYLNQKVFSEYLMPINKPTIKEQVEHMCDHVWGTRLELKAAATLFNYLSIAAYNSHCNMMCHLVGVLFSQYY